MKNKNNLPGFTADVSICNSKMPYQAITEATIYGGLVQPAQSDLFFPDRPIPRLNPPLGMSHELNPNRPIFCLRENCQQLPQFCWWELGLWNPITRSCDFPW